LRERAKVYPLVPQPRHPSINGPIDRHQVYLKAELISTLRAFGVYPLLRAQLPSPKTALETAVNMVIDFESF
jgi:hypothetical protein